MPNTPTTPEGSLESPGLPIRSEVAPSEHHPLCGEGTLAGDQTVPCDCDTPLTPTGITVTPEVAAKLHLHPSKRYTRVPDKALITPELKALIGKTIRTKSGLVAPVVGVDSRPSTSVSNGQYLWLHVPSDRNHPTQFISLSDMAEILE